MYVNNVDISYVFIFIFWKYIGHKLKKSNNVGLTLQQDSSISNTKSTCYYLEAVPFMSCGT